MHQTPADFIDFSKHAKIVLAHTGQWIARELPFESEPRPHTPTESEKHLRRLFNNWQAAAKKTSSYPLLMQTLDQKIQAWLTLHAGRRNILGEYLTQMHDAWLSCPVENDQDFKQNFAFYCAGALLVHRIAHHARGQWPKLKGEHNPSRIAMALCGKNIWKTPVVTQISLSPALGPAKFANFRIQAR